MRCVACKWPSCTKQFVFNINEKQKRPNIEPSGTPHKTWRFLTEFDTPFIIQNCCLFNIDRPLRCSRVSPTKLHGGVNHSKSWKTKIRGYDLFALFISDVFMVLSSIPAVFEVFSNMLCITVEPSYSEPLYNEVLGKVNDFLCPSNNEIWKRTSINESKPRYSEQILPVPWPFVISRFHFSNYDITSFLNHPHKD